MDTDLHVDDDGFVRAPADRCYGALTDVAAWPRFWPSTTVRDHGDDRYTLVAGRRSWRPLPGRPRRLRLDATVGAWRDQVGFTSTLTGDLDGRWEIWLEPGWGGTVVHHVLAARGAPSLLPPFRRWLRSGLWGLKDHLEAAELRELAP